MTLSLLAACGGSRSPSGVWLARLARRPEASTRERFFKLSVAGSIKVIPRLADIPAKKTPALSHSTAPDKDGPTLDPLAGRRSSRHSATWVARKFLKIAGPRQRSTGMVSQAGAEFKDIEGI